MSKDNVQETGKGLKAKYLHTFFPQTDTRQDIQNMAAAKRDNLNSGQGLRIPQSIIPPLVKSSASASNQKSKMGLKPGSVWLRGARNAVEEKLEEARVNNEVQEEARQERAVKEKGWYTDAKESASAIKQVNDPWYTADIWGDDFPEDVVEECILLASNKSKEMEVNSKANANVSTDWILGEEDHNFLKCLGEMSPLTLSENKQQTTAAGTRAKCVDHKFIEKDAKFFPEKTSFPIRCQLTYSSARKNASSSITEQQPRPLEKVALQEWEVANQATNKLKTTVDQKLTVRKDSISSKLTASQRKLEKPTRSMPSSSSQAHTTEWLRNQLEKVNLECIALKESMQTKEGESKLLREKLRTSRNELEKFKKDKSEEMEALKKGMETKVKELQKKLETTKTQMLFKSKQDESNFGKYQPISERKTSLVPDTSFASKTPADCSFKKFMSGEHRPGEVSSQTHILTSFPTILSTSLTQTSKPVTIRDKTTSFNLPPADQSTSDTKESKVQNLLDVDMFGEDDAEVIENLSCFDDIPATVSEVPEIEDFLTESDRYKKIILTCDEEEIFNLTEEIKDSFVKIIDEFPKKNQKNHEGQCLSMLVDPSILEEVEPERNYVILPNLPYNTRRTLFNDQNELPAENYEMSRPTMKEIWNIPLESFIPVSERTTDGLHEFKEQPLEPDPTRSYKNIGRYFTKLEGCVTTVFQLVGCESWEWGVFDNLILKILGHVRKMAAEIFVAVGDPRHHSALATTHLREEKVIGDCLDYSEMTKYTSIFSNEKWKDEIHVDLRRALNVIIHICSLDYRLCLHLLDPRLLNRYRVEGQKVEFNTRRELSEDESQLLHSKKTDSVDDSAIPIEESKHANDDGGHMELKLEKLIPVIPDEEDTEVNVQDNNFIKFLNCCVPEPGETVDAYKIRVALNFIGSLSNAQVFLLNKKVDDYLSKGKLIIVKTNSQNEDLMDIDTCTKTTDKNIIQKTTSNKGNSEEKLLNQTSCNVEGSLFKIAGKNSNQLSTVGENTDENVAASQGKINLEEPKKLCSQVYKPPGWSYFNRIWKEKPDGTMVEKQENENNVVWEQILWSDLKELRLTKNIIPKINKNFNEKREISKDPALTNALMQSKIPQWATSIQDSIIEKTANELEIISLSEGICISQSEKEFVENVTSNIKRMREEIEISLLPPGHYEEFNEQVRTTSEPVKRKLDDSESDSDLDDKSPTPPPAKKTFEEGFSQRVGGLSNYLLQGGPSTSEVEPVPAEDFVPPLSKSTCFPKRYFPKSWKREAYKKADIAPLKNVPGKVLTDSTQNVLNKEMELEIDKLFPNEIYVSQRNLMRQARPPDETSREPEEPAEEEEDSNDQSPTPVVQIPTNPPAGDSDDSDSDDDFFLNHTIEPVPLELEYAETSSTDSDLDCEKPTATLDECLAVFYRKLNSAGLLEILFEIFKAAGELNYIYNFHALMATFAHLLEVICGCPNIRYLPLSSTTKLAAMLREILYARPSPVVIYFINRCLTKAVRISGFVKTLCHNSDPKTFVKTEEVIYYIRGSCMMQTLCLLMDLTIDDSSWEIPLEFIRWSHYVFTKEKKVAKTWFDMKDGCRVNRCFCLQAITNLVVKVTYRSAAYYRSRMAYNLDGENLAYELQRKLEEILYSGFEIFSEMTRLDLTMFVKCTKTSYHNYIKFLEHVESVHLDNNNFASFTLSMSNFCRLQDLLSTKRYGEKIIEEIDKKPSTVLPTQEKKSSNIPPDFSNLYENQPWPSDSLNAELFYTKANESIDGLIEW